jgi:tetratricopeptide (TPR) repeat protein
MSSDQYTIEGRRRSARSSATGASRAILGLPPAELTGRSARIPRLTTLLGLSKRVDSHSAEIAGLTRSLVNARVGFHCHLANLFHRLHLWEAAANAYGRALGIRPNEQGLQFQRAWLLLDLPHRRVDAIAAFDSLMKSSPSSFGYYLMACGLQKEQRHEEAVAAFCESARLDSRANCDPDYSYNYGISLTVVG